MRKLPVTPRFTPPPQDAEEYTHRFYREFMAWVREINNQVNSLAAGDIEANYSSLSGTPSSTMVHTIGDVTRDNSPSEAGTSGSKYVRLGWLQIVDGTASSGAVVEIRALTGN